MVVVEEDGPKVTGKNMLGRKVREGKAMDGLEGQLKTKRLCSGRQ